MRLLQHGNVTVAMEFVNLIIERDSDRVPLEPSRYDPLILPFFADESKEERLLVFFPNSTSVAGVFNA